ncbi:HIT family protein [Sphingomonas sp.]|jgi:diadenosine tetraphosphate (Ap4A) HIT family hydrolase|uniref:HIT family protein n=1 Tax=Sphingomonas sp. TaxID=28214 RepID=UPI002DF4C56D|nr:HIT family protein [Sphingomonas sp.]
MNDTIRKFGHPDTLVRDYTHWVVLLRPQQPTAGSLVLAAKSDATAFADLEPGAFAELAQAIADIETALTAAVSYTRINYLMLMMVDPHVHFHIIPRYNGERTLAGVTVPDKGWPKVPDLGSAVTLEAEQVQALVAELKGLWH